MHCVCLPYSFPSISDFFVVFSLLFFLELFGAFFGVFWCSLCAFFGLWSSSRVHGFTRPIFFFAFFALLCCPTPPFFLAFLAPSATATAASVCGVLGRASLLDILRVDVGQTHVSDLDADSDARA